MALNIYFIYRATCKATDKCYIGYDTRGCRQKEHLRDAKESRFLFGRALNKYSDDELWEWDIIGITNNFEELKQMEIDLIEKHNSFHSGYNMTVGGEGCSIPGRQGSMLGKKHSVETKRKISQALAGRKKPPRTSEHSRRLSDAKKGNTFAKGRPPWNKGIPRSEETKRKISETRRRNRELIQACP